MGYGARMLRDFLQEAQQRGVSSVVLWVLEKNERARAVYEHFGFRHNGARMLEPETPEYVLRYVKAL